MKNLEKVKLKTKIIMLIISTVLIAILNFIIFNYQSLKINKLDREYTINEENINYIENDNSIVLQVDLKQKYVRNLIIHYDTDKDTNVLYNGEVANYYGIYKSYENEDVCYSYTTRCGININHKVQTMNLTFDNLDLNNIKIVVDNSLYFNWITFIFLAITINLILLLFMFKTYFLEHKHILTFILIFFLGFSLLASEHNMTGIALDDLTHYKNIISLNNDDYIPSYSDYYLENSTIKFYYLDTKFEKQDFQELLNENSAIYTNLYIGQINISNPSSLSYLLMSLTMKLSSLFGVQLTTQLFLAKLMNLLMYSLALAFAVKLMPNHKLLTMIIGLLPQSLFLATNFSCDPTVTGFLILSFAAFANEYHNKEQKIKLSNILIFVLAGLYGIFPKAIYAPFLLLMLFLPKEKFDNDKQKKIFKLLIFAIFILGMLSFILPMIFDPQTINDSRGGDVSFLKQTIMIIKCPLSFIKTFWNNAILYTSYKLFSPETFGKLSYYGSLNNDTSYYLIILTLIIAFLSEKNYTEINKKNKALMILLYLFIMCCIWGSMYLAFTPVGESTINGVQNRYFIPMLLPLLYCLSSPKLKNALDSKNCIITCVILNICAIFLLVYNVIIINYCL